MTLESINSYDDPQINNGIFAKGDPPPNGTDQPAPAPAPGDPPPNGSGEPAPTAQA